MRSFVRLAVVAIALVAPAVVEAQQPAAGAKPVIAVLYFDNNSIGKDRADYEGVGKGITEILINDMANNPNVRIVERERVQALITEQNLTRQGSIDPQTAIRLGKIVGAQYMVTGGFMSDGRGTFVLTARAVNVETSQISNPTRLTSKGDDVLALIAQLSTKLNTEMKLSALRVGEGATGMGGAMPAGQPAAERPAEPVKVADAQPAEAKPAEAKPAEAKPAAHVAAKPARKMDMKTVMLLSKALEAEDQGNRVQAVELYRLVVDKFPEYAPAHRKIEKLSRS
jgi:TolB-like protein